MTRTTEDVFKVAGDAIEKRLRVQAWADAFCMGPMAEFQKQFGASVMPMAQVKMMYESICDLWGVPANG